MASSANRDLRSISTIAKRLREARALLSGDRKPSDQDGHPAAGSTHAKYRQARTRLAVELESPVRTVHHMACTGGTLISKCLASMPNVQLLSEVDPLSGFVISPTVKYHPTDMIRLLRDSSRGTTEQEQVEAFLAAVDSQVRECGGKGISLVLRDHAHSQFCVKSDAVARPTLRGMLGERFSTLSIVTVRHPMDSWLSLLNNGWVSFEPGTLDEYCRRYLQFLDAYENLPVFLYETFVDDPSREIERMCAELKLHYSEGFKQIFHIHHLSGDSGRGGKSIARRPRRDVPDAFATAARKSTYYKLLCERLGYVT